MIPGYDDRYGNKASLQNLNDQATALNYNRTLYPEAIDRLPADEIFAIAPIMVHKHSQGRAAFAVLNHIGHGTDRFWVCVN